MKNATEIQDWHTDNRSLASMIEKHDLSLTYDPERIEEYRNAVISFYFRIPPKLIYIGFHAAERTKKLMLPNSTIEGLTHFLNNRFSVTEETLFPYHISGTGYYKDIERPDQRHLAEHDLTAYVLSYHQQEVYDQVLTMLNKTK